MFGQIASNFDALRREESVGRGVCFASDVDPSSGVGAQDARLRIPYQAEFVSE